MALKRPCLACGEPSDETRCNDCAPSKPSNRHAVSTHKRGYDARWQALSARARRLQPFCSWCRSTVDLTTDHTPEAWQRKAAGKVIRLCDIDVLCRSCNSKAGAARGVGARPSDGRPIGQADKALQLGTVLSSEGGDR